ncbi:MAG: hypothetical protein M3198_05745 [Actinomycetota bacterium]|nr:hypothetical protein [Actinomycetota bacterium]
MSLGLATALIALSLITAGCGRTQDQGAEERTTPPANNESSPTAPAATQAPTPGSSPTPTNGGIQWATCDHPEGITVSYPQGWRVNSGETLPACSAFNPQPFEVPRATEFFDAAVLLSIERVDFQTITDADARAGRVISRREEMVDGHDAVRTETESEGDALLPEGTRSTRWFVVFGRDRTLTLVTHEVDGSDYESNRNTLDEMISRLELPLES